MNVVFLLNRYGTLIGQSALMLEELGILSHGSREVLKFVNFADAYTHTKLERTTGIVLCKFSVLPGALFTPFVRNNSQ